MQSNSNKPSVVFLYTELADYFIAACVALEKVARVTIVRWPVAKEAPFKFDNISSDIKLLDRDGLNDTELLQQVQQAKPDVIFCSGWIDKGYLSVVAAYSGKIPTVVSFDNHWAGSLRQQVAIRIAKYTFLKHFSHAWVPGSPQVDYAKKLGFKGTSIFEGFYTANTTRFNTVFESLKTFRKKQNPKRFLYLGRYVKHKGIFDLWEAFRQYRTNGGDWELWCVGTGAEWDNRVEYEGITHFGFKQPHEIAEIVKDTGVYVLPSHFEPWGVSVHEMAAAGMPLILSEKIGSGSQFLNDGENGFRFKHGDVSGILKCLEHFDKMNDNERYLMSEKSNQLAKSITQDSWVRTIEHILNIR